MKRTAKLIMFFILILGVCAFSGCSKLNGKWAYDEHEPEKAVLVLNRNGSAVYKGKSYSYKTDQSFIEFQDGDETLKLRYRLEGDALFLYEQTVYTFDGNGKASGLAGLWTSGDNLSFEFTSSGKFCEDGLFTGIYRVNAEGTMFTLDYNEDFADTTCYYAIEGDQLRVDYPWRLVKVK